ncbi:ATP-binding protein [Streptomyces sp. NPDC001435]|uniref:ATP-binding protein n=1 Tax=unclassified Streptomyces TaxID=2593676 RepID=UPI0036C607BD
MRRPEYSLAADPETNDPVLLLARTRPFPADRVATWHLDHEPTAAATARQCVSGQLAAWKVEEEPAFNAELIVSELVTNAVRYGSPPLELRLILDQSLTCEVSDSAATAPRLRHARTTDEGGRGLFIVAQLAQAWGARYSADGKTIWTEQMLAPPCLGLRRPGPPPGLRHCRARTRRRPARPAAPGEAPLVAAQVLTGLVHVAHVRVYGPKQL